MSQWKNPDKNSWGFNTNDFLGGAAGLFGGLFGNDSDAYDKAMEQYQQYANQGAATQQPFYNAGTGAIPQYQEWLQGQKDPSKFINNLINQYQESPYTRYLKQQAENAGINSASASGLTGSTPFMQQQQQNATNISQQGLDNWLQNVLGINTQYGQGQHNLIQGGQNAANSLTQLYNDMAKYISEQTYNKEATNKNSFWNTLGGGIGILGSFL